MGSLRCVPQRHAVLCLEGGAAEVFASLPLEWPISPVFGSLVMRWASLVHGLVRIYIAETEEWPRSHTGDKVDIGGVWDACLSI